MEEDFKQKRSRDTSEEGDQISQPTLKDIMRGVVFVAILQCVTCAQYTIGWDLSISGDVINRGSLDVVVGDTVTLNWNGGHNVWRADGSCSDYSTPAHFKNAASYTVVQGSHPGGTTFTLPFPTPSSTTEYCYACISHWSSMAFTLRVSPSVGSIICIDENVHVLTPESGYVPLRDIRVGDKLSTPQGVTFVEKIMKQSSHDSPWVVRKGVCDATVDTVLSPAHAIKCNGKWVSVSEVGERTEPMGEIVYINLLTTNYCTDILVLQSGVLAETWDGRQRDEWRPYSYVDGYRVKCSTKKPNTT